MRHFPTRFRFPVLAGFPRRGQACPPPRRGPDPWLLSAALLAGLLLGYQLVVILLYPSWAPSATTWFRVAIAWPEALVLVLVSRWLTRTRRPGRLAWWLLSTALVVYGIGKSLAVTAAQVLFPHHVPTPWWPDLCYFVEYVCLYTALPLLPSFPARYLSGLIRVRVLLNSLLLMAAAAALSWTFLLAPMYLTSALPWLVKVPTLTYLMADLGGLVILIVVFRHRWHQPSERAALRLLLAGCLSLIVGDAWYAWLILHTGWQAGTPPDLFWILASFLLTLAALVQWRLTRLTPLPQPDNRAEAIPQQTSQPGAPLSTLRFLVPFAAAMLAGSLILARALLAPQRALPPLAVLLIAFGLLLLATAGQAVSLLENDHLRRERAVAHAQELALLEANQRMKRFLVVASHELRTPLTVLRLQVQLAERRLQQGSAQGDGEASAQSRRLQHVQQPLAASDEQLGRLEGLVQEMLETASLEAGRLELHRQPVDLARLVWLVVQQLRQVHPLRHLDFQVMPEGGVRVLADADRIGQVVTNYLTNALKYSPERAPVQVGLEVEVQQVRVWVQDQGPGLTAAQQAHLWEQFHCVPGVEVQSGSGIGLGLGLYLSKTMIERHHGQVGVESIPGQGSTFWFTLPLASLDPEGAHIA